MQNRKIQIRNESKKCPSLPQILKWSQIFKSRLAITNFGRALCVTNPRKDTYGYETQKGSKLFGGRIIQTPDNPNEIVRSLEVGYRGVYCRYLETSRTMLKRM